MNYLCIFIIIFLLRLNPIFALALACYSFVLFNSKLIPANIVNLLICAVCIYTSLAFFDYQVVYQQVIKDPYTYNINLVNNGVLGVIGVVYFLISLARLRLAKSTQPLSIIQEETNDILIGYSNEIEVTVTDEELNQHALVIGTTGSGKTTTLTNIVASCCKRNLPLIYIDGKGSIKLLQRIEAICKKYNRQYKVFTLDPKILENTASYNPLAYGNYTQWKNKIVTLTQDSENKGQEHYSLQEESYINLVCEILNKSGKYIDLEGLIGYLKDNESLQILAHKVSPSLAQRLLKTTKDNNDIIKILESFYYSHYGHLFSTSNKDLVIDLYKAIINNEIILFLLDAASYKRDTNLLGKLIINDINSAWSTASAQGIYCKGYCIFDEFAAYAAPNMANILSMQRDNGLHAIVGTQSINAISAQSNSIKRVAVELIANCNTFFIHKLNDPLDISLLTNTIGTYKTASVSSSYNYDRIPGYYVKPIDKLLLDEQSIRELKSGEGYLCRTVISSTPIKLKFNYVG